MEFIFLTSTLYVQVPVMTVVNQMSIKRKSKVQFICQGKTEKSGVLDFKAITIHTISMSLIAQSL